MQTNTRQYAIGQPFYYSINTKYDNRRLHIKRTNTAAWHEKYKRWQINVQKDGERRSFYSSIPGKEEKRDFHKKADAWLDEGLVNPYTKVTKLFGEWIEEIKLTTSKDHWR